MRVGSGFRAGIREGVGEIERCKRGVDLWRNSPSKYFIAPPPHTHTQSTRPHCYPPALPHPSTLLPSLTPPPLHTCGSVLMGSMLTRSPTRCGSLSDTWSVGKCEEKFRCKIKQGEVRVFGRRQGQQQLIKDPEFPLLHCTARSSLHQHSGTWHHLKPCPPLPSFPSPPHLHSGTRHHLVSIGQVLTQHTLHGVKGDCGGSRRGGRRKVLAQHGVRCMASGAC